MVFGQNKEGSAPTREITAASIWFQELDRRHTKEAEPILVRPKYL